MMLRWAGFGRARGEGPIDIPLAVHAEAGLDADPASAQELRLWES